MAPPTRITPEWIQECERVVTKTFPACVAFHKPSFLQQLKNGTLDMVLVYALLSVAARSSPTLIRRYGANGGAPVAAESFATKTLALVNGNLDQPSLADVQALCLLVIHEWGNRNAIRAYVYLGQAARTLQMHRIISIHSPASDTDKFHQEESFRRTLWLVFMLDSLLTSTPGRYMALTPNDYSNVSLPCSDVNFVFGNPVVVQTLTGQQPTSPTTGLNPGEIGEFGSIILATNIWRDIVQCLSATSGKLEDSVFNDFTIGIQNIRQNLPLQYHHKAHQINLHITMGTGFTYAMLHSLLHSSSVFINRRMLLNYVIALLSALEAGSDNDIVTVYPILMLFSVFTSSATAAYLCLKGLTPPGMYDTVGNIVNSGLHFIQEARHTWPLVQTWSRHLGVMQRILKQPNDGNSDIQGAHQHRYHNHDGASNHSVKDEVASNADDSNPDAMDYEKSVVGGGGGEEVVMGENGGNDSVNGGGGNTSHFTPHNNNNHHQRDASESARGDSEPPAAQTPGSVAASTSASVPPAPTNNPSAAIPRRTGITTINGGSAGISTPSTSSPPPQPQQQQQQQPPANMTENGSGGGVATPSERVPLPGSSGSNNNNNNNNNSIKARSVEPVPQHQQQQPPAQDISMSASHLCKTFERQLLDLDDLAAFMGGGV